jgi:alpha-galactosidase
MVNPNSDLYRSHPDWVLRSPAAPQILARNQLVLDLTRSEVQSYLFERLNDLLSEYPIDYLKWDMNRTNFQPGNAHGQAVGHSQTLAVYQLMSRLRQAHPSVEIESCCSGGGRADFGILAHTDRIWTSDSNDAMDRLAIQRGFSFFFPPEIMGSHVGPNTCHITGRVLTMETRAAVAMFGHMGIEADLTTMTDEQLSTLQAAVALHKEHRPLLHSGRLRRLDTDSAESAFGVSASDGSEAIFSYAQLSSLPHSVGGQLRFVGLNRDGRYRICIIWPQRLERYSESVIEVINGAIISGDVLMNMGIQLPIMNPQTLLLFHLQQLK